MTEVRDLAIKKNSLEGVFAQDVVSYITHHGERTPVPRTIEIPFAFFRVGERVLLVVMERKLLANNIANRLGEVLFATSGFVVEARIEPEVLRDFHEKNPLVETSPANSTFLSFSVIGM